MFLAIKRWNSLSESYKSVEDVKFFKNRVKKEMMINKLNFPEWIFTECLVGI